MILERYEKQPADKKDFDIDYRPWLTEISDTLFSVSVISVACLSTPADASLVCSSAVIFAYAGVTATGVKLWMENGTDGKRYKLTGRVTTVGGRIDEFELIFKIKDT